MERQPVKLKRFFFLLAAWAVAVGFAIGGSFLYTAYQGWQYQDSVVPFLKEVIPALSEWDEEKTLALLAHETVETLPEGNIGKAMKLFSRLGTLEEMDEPQFVETVEVPGEGDAVTTLITYTVSTRFSEGPAEFKVQIVDRGDHLQLYNFHLGAEVLLEPAR